MILGSPYNTVQYCTMFTDAATSLRWGYFHKEKNGATEAIKYFNSLMKTQYDSVIKCWRLDCGKEYSPKMLGELAADLGQIIETTTPYFPEQDGRAERSIGIIISRVRTVSIEKNIPKFLWPELVRSQLHIANRTATSVLNGETPIQAFNRHFTGVDENSGLSHLRVLGCKVYVRIPVEKRVLSQKLDKRAEIGILVGYEGQHIYRIFIPSRRRVIRSSTVRFDENSSLTSTPPDEELWEPISYLPKINVVESSGEETSTSNQHEFSPNILTPFEHLSFDRHQEDKELERVENEVIEAGDEEDGETRQDENLLMEHFDDPPVSTTAVSRGRPPESKNKVYQKVNRVTRSTAESFVPDQGAAFLSLVAASQSLLTVDNTSDPKTLVEAMSCKDSWNWKRQLTANTDHLQRKIHGHLFDDLAYQRERKYYQVR